YVSINKIESQNKFSIFFFQAEDGIRDLTVTGVQTCALPICVSEGARADLCQAGLGRARPQGDLGAVAGGARRGAVSGGSKRGRRSEERRVGKSVDLGGRRIIKKKKQRRAV